MDCDVIGTVRHERPSPACVNRQSVAGYSPSASEILRDHRRRDLLAAIEEWRHASGSERGYWRGQTTYLLREWRRLHVQPERAAFQAAVARSRA